VRRPGECVQGAVQDGDPPRTRLATSGTGVPAHLVAIATARPTGTASEGFGVRPRTDALGAVDGHPVCWRGIAQTVSVAVDQPSTYHQDTRARARACPSLAPRWSVGSGTGQTSGCLT
jgi:hypothetical protein